MATLNFKFGSSSNQSLFVMDLAENGLDYVEYGDVVCVRDCTEWAADLAIETYQGEDIEIN